jgi:hypothetical protein
VSWINIIITGTILIIVTYRRDQVRSSIRNTWKSNTRTEISVEIFIEYQNDSKLKTPTVKRFLSLKRQ